VKAHFSYLPLVAALLIAPAVRAGEVADTEDEEDHASQADEGAPAKTPPAKTPPTAFDKKWLDPYFTSETESNASALFRSGDFVTAAKEFSRILAGLPKQAPERNALRFLLAVATENQSSWQAAGDIFEELWTSYPLLAPYHARPAATCAAAIAREHLPGWRASPRAA
jgi:TolA-binding protein